MYVCVEIVPLHTSELAPIYLHVRSPSLASALHLQHVIAFEGDHVLEMRRASMLDDMSEGRDKIRAKCTVSCRPDLALCPCTSAV